MKEMDRRVGPPRPQRVLIVEDSEDIRAMWDMWLTHWGFTVDHARNGAEGVLKAVTHPPDLILMDMWMPVVDGLTATAQLRALEATAGIPILAISADSRSVMRQFFDDYLVKPVHPDELLEHMRGAFARRVSHRH